MQDQSESKRNKHHLTNDNLEEMTMAELLEQSPELQPVVRGQVIQGTIVKKDSNELLVNVGSKYEGIVRSKDLERVNPDYLATLQIGDEIPVYVVHLEDDDGYVVLSLSKAVIEYDWEKAQEIYEAAKVFDGKVVSSNKGGLIVNFGSVRGFVPGSQLDPVRISNLEKANQWSDLLGEKLTLKIIEVDKRRNRLIMSEKAAVEEARQKHKEALLEKLNEGDVIEGRVTSLADFGAFIDLGGTEGLIHLSELSWTQIAHPGDVVSVGEDMDVYVLNIDHERQRIGLSLKRLQPEPWSQVLENYQPGQIVSAEITKLTNFGAFARVDNALEGLIHISELSDKNINHPRDIVSEGDKVELRIISIEPDKKRMGLSLKQVIESEESYAGTDADPSASSSDTPDASTSDEPSSDDTQEDGSSMVSEPELEQV